jgi:aminopeptidase N
MKDSLQPTTANSLPTIRRLDYTPPSHQIPSIALHFELGLEDTLVTSEFGYISHSGQPTDLILDGDELVFVRAWLNGQALPSEALQVSEQQLVVPAALAGPEGRLTLQTRLNPTANTELMGLYASRGGLYTQCESQGFRRITYFLDRPDVLSVYTVTLRGLASAFPTLLSNGNLIKQAQDGDHLVCTWHDPFPKPSYLFALVAADLQCIEETITSASGASKLLQVYTKAQDLGRADFALQSLKRAVFWDEKRFGLELDLERFMIVAVPDFNSGAMENKGLNLFNTKYVLADPQTATDRDHELVEAVIGHEYFHNWTGNRITCRDWFQLTLKEGLTVFRDQEFTGDMLAHGLPTAQAASARAVKRIDDVRTLRAHQFPEDAGPMAHPIRPAEYQEIRNFYTATVYEKGAEVIRMLQTLLGVDGFRKGMDLYFARHDGSAATCEDFVSSILDANERSDLFDAFMRWYATPGTPVVQVTDHYDPATGQYSLIFRQQVSANSPQQQPLPIPMVLGFLAPDGSVLQSENLPSQLLLTDQETSVCFQLHPDDQRLLSGHKPVPSLLRGFSAPVLLEFPYTVSQLQTLAQHDPDAFNRWDACQRLIMGHLLAEPTVDAPAVAQSLVSILLDDRLSPGFKTQCWQLPSESVVAEAWAQQGHAIDPQAIRLKAMALSKALAQAGQKALALLDAGLDQTASDHYSPDASSVGRRALSHLAQSLVNLLDASDERRARLLKRYQSCNNMTARMAHLASLIALGDGEGQFAQQALDDFAQQFADNMLAMDKWFTVQITTTRLADPEGTQTASIVERLLSDPRYDITNPNRVRSVLGAFFAGNLAGFHQADGRGYQLWAQELGRLDQRNGQLAARLARSLDRWRAYEPGRKAKMQAAIEQLAAGDKRSADMTEVCERLLKAQG